MARRVRGGGWCICPRGVLPIRGPELSGEVACVRAASCPGAGGHRVIRPWCRRGHPSFSFPDGGGEGRAGALTAAASWRRSSADSPPCGRAFCSTSSRQPSSSSSKSTTHSPSSAGAFSVSACLSCPSPTTSPTDPMPRFALCLSTLRESMYSPAPIYTHTHHTCKLNTQGRQKH